MAAGEWIREHRELQYLRAAAATRPRKKAGAKGHSKRARYAAERWRKLREVTH